VENTSQVENTLFLYGDMREVEFIWDEIGIQ
jgi:hypothetical protein